jgi:hypothetical protein
MAPSYHRKSKQQSSAPFHAVTQFQYSSPLNAGTVKSVLSDHVWAGLLTEVEMYGIATFGTGPSGLE